jgi:hypothetical protein
MAGLGFLTVFTPYIRHGRLVAALAAKSAGSPSVPRQNSFLDMRQWRPLRRRISTTSPGVDRDSASCVLQLEGLVPRHRNIGLAILRGYFL